MPESNGSTPPEMPRSVTYEVGMDSENELILFQEKAANGVQLVKPQQMIMPFDTILGIAANIIIAQQQKKQQARKSGIMVPGRPM